MINHDNGYWGTIDSLEFFDLSNTNAQHGPDEIEEKIQTIKTTDNKIELDEEKGAFSRLKKLLYQIKNWFQGR